MCHAFSAKVHFSRELLTDVATVAITRSYAGLPHPGNALSRQSEASFSLGCYRESIGETCSPSS